VLLELSKDIVKKKKSNQKQQLSWGEKKNLMDK
jgi:hypothetical protein